MDERLCVAGGDARALRLAALLQARGYGVTTVGLEPDDERTADIAGADALLFAYPFSAREGKLPTLTGLTLYARDALALAKRGAAIVCGAGLEEALALPEHQSMGWRVSRYSDDEAFLQANADISAEAAVYEAMRRTNGTINGMTALVTGYGRFGRALAQKLLALGADVWIGARREESLRLAASDGMRALPYRDLPLIAGNIKMLLNTAPARVLSDETLAALPNQTPMLELASAPYALDAAQAKARAPYYEILPALPARYAPEAAASALLSTVLKTLREVRT